MGNIDTNKGQSQGQNPGQNPNMKTPQQDTKAPQQGQNQGQKTQPGFDKNRQPQTPARDTGTQRTGSLNDESDEESSEKEDLFGNRKDQGKDQGSMGRTDKH